MKNLYIILVMLAIIGGFSACNDALNVVNPNNQTTYDFGDSESELQEAVIACYNRIRLEGSFARVGYTMDPCVATKYGIHRSSGILSMTTSISGTIEMETNGSGATGTMW